jgi:xylose isomerase
VTTSLHSICRWTFNAGKGGFVPADQRPEWASDKLSTAKVVRLIKQSIAPRLPDNVALGFELHYDGEVNEENAREVAEAMGEAGVHLAMITPGAHAHWAYGGVSSLDPDERKQANTLGRKTVDLAYGRLKPVWHPQVPPTLVLWNGSYGYDLASVGVRQMYNNLKESIAELCKYEQAKGGELFIAFEPKPNEGHPAMLIPTVASALLFWRKLEDDYGIPRRKKGVNKELGHTEMIGLDPVYDTVEELDDQALVHMHLNSQGYSDGIILGGPGKYDIDHGARVSGINIAIAGLIQSAGYSRWKGHDIVPRPYDSAAQGIERVVRSILSWEACERAAATLDTDALMRSLAARETAAAEDIVRHAVATAQRHFDALYGR